MGDEYYLEPFAQPEGRYHDFSDVLFSESAYMKPAPRPLLPPMQSNIACRSPTREVPKAAYPYPFSQNRAVMKNMPRDSSPIFDTCDGAATKAHQKKLNTAAVCGKEMLVGGFGGLDVSSLQFTNVNLFMFMFLVLIFMCVYTMYGVMRIQKELSKLRKLLKLNRG
jgi:hypothetical protein